MMQQHQSSLYPHRLQEMQLWKPLLQIFLVGQEELRAKLQDPSLEQLRQRVTAAAHLHPLNQDQVAAYIIHRLKVVGWDNNPTIKSSILPVIEYRQAMPYSRWGSSRSVAASRLIH